MGMLRLGSIRLVRFNLKISKTILSIGVIQHLN